MKTRWSCHLALVLAAASFDVGGVRTYQIVWNELTVLGPAWRDPANAPLTDPSSSVVSPANVPTLNMKRRASEEPELQPPARRGPFLFNRKSSSGFKLLHARDSMSVGKVSLDKGKGKEVIEVKSGTVSDSELSDYELQ